MEPPVFCLCQPHEGEGSDCVVINKRGCGSWSALLGSQLFLLAGNRREAGTCPVSPKWKNRP